jgi:NitT/TauT family transport system ATP-binding protein
LRPGAEGTNGILIENVVHSYRGIGKSLTVLDRISLSIKRGEFVALVDQAGCGKTTLLDILSGLVELQRGRVVVGHSPPAVGRPDTARMFARDALLPWRTAYANVDFAMATRNPDRDRRRVVIHELLDDVGLNGFENAYPRQLSQGMRQRVALARTFSLESDFVFLDEPFARSTRRPSLVLQDKLLRLWEKMQSTVVLVSHDLAEAVALADRVVVMSARPGRIAADIAIDLPRPRSVTALKA